MEISNIDILKTVFSETKKYDREINFSSEKDFRELFESFIYTVNYVSEIVNNAISKNCTDNIEYRKVLRILNIFPSEYEYELENGEKQIIIDPNELSKGLNYIYKRIEIFFENNKFNFAFENESIGESRYRFKNFRKSMKEIKKLIIKLGRDDMKWGYKSDLGKDSRSIKERENTLYRHIESIKDKYKGSRDTIKKIKSEDYHHHLVDGKNKIFYTQGDVDIKTAIRKIDTILGYEADKANKVIRYIVENTKFHKNKPLENLNSANDELERKTKKSKSKDWF